MSKKGTIGVTSDNIFPVIKKFLYSDHEIFLREIVSNAVDATQKLKTLTSVGEFKGETGDLRVTVNELLEYDTWRERVKAFGTEHKNQNLLSIQGALLNENILMQEVTRIVADLSDKIIAEKGIPLFKDIEGMMNTIYGYFKKVGFFEE